MRMRTHLIGATATAVGLAAAGAGVGIAAAPPGDRPPRRRARPAFGSLRSEPQTVIADDGTPLYVEVDEARRGRRR